MLEKVESVFDNKEMMMKHLKKAGYAKNMEYFRNENGHYFDEMIDYVSGAEDKSQALKEIADDFTSKIRLAFTNKYGKIWGKTQADLNLFMVYYVFPAILLTENDIAEEICNALCEAWAVKFPGNKIGYTTYDKLLPKFREKIFGIL